MNTRKLGLLLLLFGLLATTATAQKFTLSGTIRDASDGEDLPFANIIVTNLEGVGANSNNYGFYSLTLEKGNYTVAYQYIGYETITKEIELNADTRIDIELQVEGTEMEEVVISAEVANENITSTEGSVTKVDMKEVRKIAMFGGEPDVTRAITLNPGVKPSGEGSGGFYVRGGGLDQNLILLDEALVYNPSHLLGFFSVFNGDAVKGATVYKGGMPAEYGGRTSSVMDIRMRDGNKKEYGVVGGIGLLSGRLTVDGPIVKDKGSFIVSGRRTYADLFLRLSNDETQRQSDLYFYDLTAKANYDLNENNRIFISGYFGRDRLGFGDQFGLEWGNMTGTVRYNHLFSDKLFSNTTLLASQYDYEFGFGVDEERIGIESIVNNLSLKQDFTWYLNSKNTLKFGGTVIDHAIEPGNLNAGAESGVAPRSTEQKNGIEAAVFVQNEQELGARLKLNYGLRYSYFQQMGPGTAYEFDDDGNVISSTTYDENEGITNYGGFEPRLSANYVLNEQTSLKLGYNRNYQYIHLLTNATASTPTDVWVMSSKNIKPQIADQISLGLFRNFKENAYETSVEVYYKDMQNVIDYRNGADIFFNEQLEGELLRGDGEAYGVEFLVKKNTGKLTGWASYTLSRTFREIDGINGGEKFPARQDRIHDLSVVLLYQLSKKVTLSANFVYYTGDAVTYPVGRYVVDGNVVPLYQDRNAGRLPDYHRLDLGLVLQGKRTKRYESDWTFSLYNAYGRENAFAINFEPVEDNPTQSQAVKLALFKYVPSVTYNFKF